MSDTNVRRRDYQNEKIPKFVQEPRECMNSLMILLALHILTVLTGNRFTHRGIQIDVFYQFMLKSLYIDHLICDSE